MTAEPEIQKVDGRSRQARAARAQVREPARGSVRNEGVVGRNGEVLSRKRTSVGDPFHIPAELIEPGWEMQWIAHSVVGNTEVVMDQNLAMLENGWRPVMSDRERFKGRYMPANATGHIIRGGQGLYERPKELCEQARAEDVRLAKQLISDRNDSLKLSGLKSQMPEGFDMSRRGTGGNIRMSIDRGLDIPAPSHQLAEPGE